MKRILILLCLPVFLWSNNLRAQCTLTTTNISCFGICDGIINVNAIGGNFPYHYSLNCSAYQMSSAFTNLCAGTYTVTVLGLNGTIICSNILTTITEPQPLTYVIATIEPLCFGDANGSIELLVMGGTNPYTATFGLYPPSYPSSDSIIFSSLPAGGDSVYVTDANGCENVSYVNLTQPSLLVINSHSEVNPTCYGYSNGSATFGGMGGTSPYSYQVLDASGIVVGNSSTTSSLIDGSYDYLITDYNGCTATLNFNITHPPPLVVTITATPPSSPGLCDGYLTGNVTGGPAPYNYSWSNPCIGSSPVSGGLCAGDSCCIVVTDANNCWSGLVCATIPNVISGIIDVSENTKRTILKIINVLGEPTKPKPNTPLFYIYNDGTVEKRIVIE